MCPYWTYNGSNYQYLVDVCVLVPSYSNILKGSRRMNWADIGGRTKAQHVVVEWNYGIRVQILCKHHIIQNSRMKDNRQLPHCKQCITALSELIEESRKTTQLEIIMTEKERNGHNCGWCGAQFTSTQDLYRHQQNAHDPDGIVFSELGLPK